jgi:hypothetical protein
LGTRTSAPLNFTTGGARGQRIRRHSRCIIKMQTHASCCARYTVYSTNHFVLDKSVGSRTPSFVTARIS